MFDRVLNRPQYRNNICLLDKTQYTCVFYDAQYPVISPNFLVWKFPKKAKFLQNFRQLTRNSAGTLKFPDKEIR